MDRLFRSIALVQRPERNRIKLLLRWQGSLNWWEFIVADRLNKESFRESVTREVAWQLNLDRRSDFLVSNMAQLSTEYIETQPDDTQRHIAIAFYNVHLFKQSAVESITRDPGNAWISAAEVCKGKSTDGQTIDPRVVSWINKYGVVQPWQ